MQDFFRGRRLRQTPQMRDFFRETPPVLVEDLIMPYFVVETEDQSLEKEIGTMPGQYDLSLTKLERGQSRGQRPQERHPFRYPGFQG